MNFTRLSLFVNGSNSVVKVFMFLLVLPWMQVTFVSTVDRRPRTLISYAFRVRIGEPWLPGYWDPDCAGGTTALVA